MISHSPTQTKTIAKKLASELKPGAVLALVGDLGAGKTQFVKGLAEYFGIKKNITSPTFVLLKPYQTKNNQIKKLIHIDCYRLNSPKELLAIGFQEFLENKNNLVVIEWADKIKSLLPKNTVWIKFSLGQKETERKIEIKK
jgi:tRNA threonylcarbamoyladenosine biosynthesis protein TsaE